MSQKHRCTPFFCLFLSFVLLLMTLTGCSAERPTAHIYNSDQDVRFNVSDRQIQICDRLNYDMENLTDEELNKIFRVEELLEVLDNKYDRTFEFISYFGESAEQRDGITARCDDLLQSQFVYLKCDKDGNYSDNFIDRLSQTMLAASIEDKISGINNRAKCIEVKPKIDLLTVPNNISELSGKTSVDLIVVTVSDGLYDEFKSVCDTVDEWYKENDFEGSYDVYRVSEEQLERYALFSYDIDRLKLSDQQMHFEHAGGIANLVSSQ